MDSHRIDQLARELNAARTRRGALRLLAAGLAGPLLLRLGRGEASAACRTFKQKCGTSKKCCAGLGIHCKQNRCRCRSGWKHCLPGSGCQHLKSDEQHCGSCGNICLDPTPCCINGSCQETCGDTGSCCGDCFAERLDPNQPPVPGTETCCQADGGTVCSNKPGPGDDRCCYSNETCVKGRCCSKIGLWGETNCGGRCCGKAACCNGKCCKKGKVCARKPGDSKKSCVSGNRSCQGNAQCYIGEQCRGNKCCSGVRRCFAGGLPVCCKADEYCVFPNSPAVAACIKVHQGPTYRPHRVRP